MVQDSHRSTQKEIENVFILIVSLNVMARELRHSLFAISV
jgi:hypothetical protein